MSGSSAVSSHMDFWKSISIVPTIVWWQNQNRFSRNVPFFFVHCRMVKSSEINNTVLPMCCVNWLKFERESRPSSRRAFGGRGQVKASAALSDVVVIILKHKSLISQRLKVNHHCFPQDFVKRNPEFIAFFFNDIFRSRCFSQCL